MGIKVQTSGSYLYADQAAVADLPTQPSSLLFTVSFWLYVPTANPFGDIYEIVNRSQDQDSPVNGIWQIKVNHRNELRCRINYGGGSGTNKDSSSNMFPAGWSHWVVEHESTPRIQFYRDGSYDVGGSGRNDLNQHKPGLGIFALVRKDDESNVVNHMDITGTIVAELAEWHRVLTSTEISALADGYSPAFFDPIWYVSGRELDANGDCNAEIGGFQLVQNGSGSLVTGDHPAMRYPRRKAQILVPSAGAPPATADDTMALMVM